MEGLLGHAAAELEAEGRRSKGQTATNRHEREEINHRRYHAGGSKESTWW